MLGVLLPCGYFIITIIIMNTLYFILTSGEDPNYHLTYNTSQLMQLISLITSMQRRNLKVRQAQVLNMRVTKVVLHEKAFPYMKRLFGYIKKKVFYSHAAQCVCLRDAEGVVYCQLRNECLSSPSNRLCYTSKCAFLNSLYDSRLPHLVHNLSKIRKKRVLKVCEASIVVQFSMGHLVTKQQSPNSYSMFQVYSKIVFQSSKLTIFD